MPALALAIVADDLTGALDASAPFAAIAGGVVAATSPEALPEALERSPSVIAVSTRSREIPARAAHLAVEKVLSGLPEGVRIIKKIDSRLKGNITAELAAFGARPLVVLPAIPAFGRVVRNGNLEGFGVSVPIPVRTILGELGDMADVPDTVDVDGMLAAVLRAPEGAVLVGARGLSQALAKTLGLAPLLHEGAFMTPMCFAVGSTDPITLAQVELLRGARSGLAYVAAPSGRVRSPSGPAADVTLIQVTQGEEMPPLLVAKEFARGLRSYLLAARSMLLTGGATAEAALDALGIGVLTVAGEAEPGMAICHAGEQVVVTKSGGFGAPDAFIRLASQVPQA